MFDVRIKQGNVFSIPILMDTNRWHHQHLKQHWYDISYNTKKAGIYKINGQYVVLMQFLRNKFIFTDLNDYTKCINGKF